MFIRALKGFCRSESGAVTIDFVILTAIIASFGLTVVMLIAMGINPVAANLNALISPNSDFSAKFVQVGK